MDFSLMMPELVMAGIVVIVLLSDLTIGNKKTTAYIFCALTAGLFAWILSDMGKTQGVLLKGAYIADGMSWFSKLVVLLGTVLVGIMSIDSLKVKDKYAGAYYTLLGASTLGMMFLVSSKELITLYVSLELATISLYALTAIYKHDSLSMEGGIKYLILGAVSSGILLYGLSLIYGMARTTYLDRIMFYTSQAGLEPLFIVGMIMVLLGVGFKLSMVPMHVWTPDVYHGAPTPITAFISVASKAAGFIFAIRLFSYTFVKLNFVWVPLMAVLAFLTMTVGNLAAIPQKNIKRLLAYSTISQAGYILVGFVGASVIGMSSVMFYLLAYTVTNIAAFSVVVGFSRQSGSDDLRDYAGLAQKEPVLALTLLVALLSLAGIPPTAGFVGKLYLFYAAMQNYATSPWYLWLVVAAALNSTVSLYYYLLVLKQMYIYDRKKEVEKIRLPLTIKVVLIITILAIFALGLMPGAVIDITTDIAQKIFM